MLKSVASFVAALLIMAASSFQAFAAETRSVIILHTNDIHGKVFPELDRKDGIWKGGLASVASLADGIRRENPGAVILVDAGDMFQGTPVSNIFKGDPVTDFMNHAGYECSVIGNHEFDFGIDGFEREAARRKFPMLCANIREKKTGKIPPFAKKSIVVERNGIKIGLIGVTVPFGRRSGSKSPMKDFYFEDPLKCIEECRDELRSDGIKTVGVISHNGYEKDLEFASKLSGIDFIIGGHSHTYVDTPAEAGGIPVFQAGEHGKALGFIRLEIDPDSGKALSYEGRLIPVPGYDMALQKTIESYEDRVKEAMREEIGLSNDDIPRKRISEKSGTLVIGDFISDIIRKSADADVCFINTSSFKNGLSRGVIRKEDIFYAIPYDNRVIAYNVKGSSLRKIIEYYIDRKTFTQVSGISCSYDSSRPEGRRVYDISINGDRLDDDRIYRISSMDFLFNVSDDCPEIKNAKGFEYCDCGFMRDEAEKYIRSLKSVSAPSGIRINVVGSDPDSRNGH
ncbi:MAG: bifunctional metallophosphatase/5'-nucleotidase [bacterium]|nr:bifunctional metallophosphatase/5'-nucleotidase [bacterium]